MTTERTTTSTTCIIKCISQSNAFFHVAYSRGIPFFFSDLQNFGGKPKIEAGLDLSEYGNISLVSITKTHSLTTSRCRHYFTFNLGQMFLPWWTSAVKRSMACSYHQHTHTTNSGKVAKLAVSLLYILSTASPRWQQPTA